MMGRIGREERIAIWRLCGNLLESGFEIERAFALVREMYSVQGKRWIAARVGAPGASRQDRAAERSGGTHRVRQRSAGLPGLWPHRCGRGVCGGSTHCGSPGPARDGIVGEPRGALLPGDCAHRGGVGRGRPLRSPARRLLPHERLARVVTQRGRSVHVGGRRNSLDRHRGGGRAGHARMARRGMDRVGAGTCGSRRSLLLDEDGDGSRLSPHRDRVRAGRTRSERPHLRGAQPRRHTLRSPPNLGHCREHEPGARIRTGDDRDRTRIPGAATDRGGRGA